jgi:hypothetical protein
MTTVFAATNACLLQQSLVLLAMLTLSQDRQALCKAGIPCAKPGHRANEPPDAWPTQADYQHGSDQSQHLFSNGQRTPIHFQSKNG